MHPVDKCNWVPTFSLLDSEIRPTFDPRFQLSETSLTMLEHIERLISVSLPY